MDIISSDRERKGATEARTLACPELSAGWVLKKNVVTANRNPSLGGGEGGGGR
jgi:hypothetical protein